MTQVLITRIASCILKPFIHLKARSRLIPVSLKHYIHCPFWLYLLSKAQPNYLDAPSPFPLTRLGLVDPSEFSLKSVACSFAGYHAVKRSLAPGFKLAMPLSTDQIWSAHRVFWDSYCAAAQDCGLPHRAFSTIVADSLPGVSDTPAFAMPVVPISDL